MKMLASFTRAALLAAALLALASIAAAQTNVSPAGAAPPGGTWSGPPSPQPAPGNPASDDMAERVSLDQQELSTALPAHPAQAGQAPGRVRPSADGVSLPGIPISGVAGLGLSAAFLALGLVFLASQRKHLRLILKRPLFAAPTRPASGPAMEAAARKPVGTTAAASRLAEVHARPAVSSSPQAETESLRKLATELQVTISELRAERSRWEKEWEQRELQWGRLVRGMEFGGVRETSPATTVPVLPAALVELEQDSLPALGELSAPGTGASSVLARVEQMLSQGISAEEISRRLRVGLREIQWMMRLGAMEARS